MKYLSVCSGIEAVTCAWHDFAEPVAFCEFDPFPSATLAHHYPDTPNLGDLTAWRTWDEDILAEVDVLVGGTPCQAFSIAGLRQSLDDARGNLSLIFLELADAIDNIRRNRGRPGITILWENVPGVLSTKDNAFGCFLAGMAGGDTVIAPNKHRGWTNAGVVSGPARTIAWRVLDAQYFGLAQRRKRVFVVGRSGTGKHPAEILFESEGVRRDTAPRREKGEVTPTIPARRTGGGGLGTDFDCDGGLIPQIGGSETPVPAWPADIACTLNAKFGDKMGLEDQHALNGASMFVPGNSLQDADQEYLIMSSGQANAAIAVGISPTPNCNGDGAPIAFQSMDSITQACKPGPVSAPLNVGQSGGHAVVASGMQVRRLTPVECERLQGFPDNYTRIPYRNKAPEQCPDGPRYKALGNAMAVPVMRWIGSRIVTAIMEAEK